jgi:dTMP kinase
VVEQPTTDEGQLTTNRRQTKGTKRRGLFITLEGIDGAGKSTQLLRLAAYLRRCGCRICVTREPGGTPIGEQMRRVLLASRNTQLAPLAELALIYAARAQHLKEVVRPALARGEVVLSDRFNDASFAYQGYGRTIGTPAVRAFDQIICGSTQTDVTLLLDVAPQVALQRATTRETRNRSRRSRFEIAGLEFLERVRNGYLAIARREPHRVKVVDANRPIEEVQRDIRRLVDRFLENSGAKKKKDERPGSKAKLRNT